MKATLASRALILLLVLSLLPTAAFAGTESEDYVVDGDGNWTIYTAEGLLALSKTVYVDNTSSGNSFAGKTVTLKANIDLSNLSGSWQPIGTEARFPFAGTFDGGGFSVSGLNITGGGLHSGLFGYLGERGVIRNVRVGGSVTAASGKQYIGGLCGYNAGLIERCESAVTVNGAGCTVVGGLCGYNAGVIER